MLAVPGALAQVIDFQSLEMNDGNIHDWGYVYEEDGFRLSHPESEPYEFATFGTQEYRYPGSTALFNNTVNGVITLEKVGRDAFDLFSIEIANLNLSGPVTVSFVGELMGGGQVFSSFTTSYSDQNVLETHVFPSDFRDLESVSWTQASPFHQFDNIEVPEPTAVALLCLGGLALLRRR
jgi:hypothetical protein